MNMNWRQRAGQFMLQLLPSARIAYATTASENAKKRVDKVTEEAEIGNCSLHSIHKG